MNLAPDLKQFNSDRNHHYQLNSGPDLHVTPIYGSLVLPSTYFAIRRRESDQLTLFLVILEPL